MSARANTVFKLGYRRYFDIALAISLTMHLLAFMFIPHIEINPEEDQIDELEVIDIPPEIEIPPPPKEIARPKVPVESLDESVEEEDTIEDTTLDLENLPDAPPPPPPGGGDFFVFDKAPQIRRYVDPEYPQIAMETGMEGVVQLKLTVDERGRVISAMVLSGDKVFHAPALAAAKKWTFQPAEMSGNAVKATIIIPLEFTIDR
ncbi:MAG: energy transducer TonB [Gemmatimonadetes bacterium]|nr:energy transducer TonB [Gemmatimonadota bacterium]